MLRVIVEGAPRPLDPGKENAIMNPLQLPHGEGRKNLDPHTSRGFEIQL
jgi:hypothetical protein